MATYAIGDIQGCLAPLKALLKKINYQSSRDQLWFTGDIVNRGPQSLETLRFIKQLPQSTVCVLGNHDLALLALSKGMIPIREFDTSNEVLDAPDVDELMEWLRRRPFLHHDSNLGFTITHAGIYPLWDLPKAIKLARECEALLSGPDYHEFLRHMFGSEPNTWQDSLKGWDRARFITNAFTRMRFCNSQGGLDLDAKGEIAAHPEIIPWFAIKDRPAKTENLIFGHWAALNGQCDFPNLYPLDTGCVYGNCLRAFCLETKKNIEVEC